MEVLKSITKLSTYRPKGGLKKVLFDLVRKEGYSRKDAEQHFKERKKEGQFSVVYKRLKNDLMEGLLNTSLNQFSKSSADKIKIWKRHLQTKMLLKIQNKTAGIKHAIHTVVLAEKSNEWEVVVSLCKELMIQYSLVSPDKVKYYKYLKKFNQANQIIQNETTAELIYQDLVLCQRTRKPIDHIPAQIDLLEEIAMHNKHAKFRYLYYSIKNLYYQLTPNDTNLLANSQLAYQFFDTLKQELPYHTKLNFIIKLIPYHILKKEFTEAKNLLDRCILLPPEGSVNWHLILQYQCYFGLYANDLELSLDAYRKAFSKPIKFENPDLLDKWRLFYGYLTFYAKIGQIEWNCSFRLRRFLNIQEERGNEEQKINLIIIELIHLLADGKREEYLNKVEQIEPTLSNRLKKQKFKRCRYFLRMLKIVVRGNYRASLVSAHAHIHLNKLRDTSIGLDTTIFDREIVPYELLWDSILKILAFLPSK